MGLEAALLSLTGLTVGDAFGQSFYVSNPKTWIDQQILPAAPWHWTDDTQIALSVVEELRQRGWIDQDYLARRMAWRYTTDPARGYGRITHQALDRIAQGEYFRTVSRSVYDGGSYGSSGAARTAPLGAFFAESPAKAAREAPLAAAITHAHPESLAGAQAVAVAAAIAANPHHPVRSEFLREILAHVPASRVRQAIQKVIDIPGDDLAGCLRYLAGDDFSTAQTAIPFALWCAAHHLDNYKEALWQTVAGMGMRDTTCAIVGGIVAVACGQVPADWAACREPLPDSALLAEIDHPWETRDKDQAPAVPKKPDVHKSGDAGSPISIRVDPLTGLPNLLGLLDWVEMRIEMPEGSPFSLVIVQLVPLWDVNRSAGRTAGDNLIRDCSKALQEAGFGPVFRTGGDKFVVFLQDQSQAIEKARQISQRMDQPGCRLPRTALVHFPFKQEAIGGRLIACLVEALRDLHYQNNDGVPREFEAPVIRAMPDFSWMMVDMVDQMRRMGQIVDQADRLAQTDVISQLPNLRMAMTTLEAALKQANENSEPLAILMFDGDNLRQYNEISYEAGDEAIRLLGTTLKGQLRQTDTLARWRTGDEFLIILPDTARTEAEHIGNRICTAVSQASRSWLFPTTISGGLAVYPQQGPTLQDLLQAAEKGLKAAKEAGKNRVVTGEG
jgi:diguanylate cyclase (GGDEF)-like protein